MKLLIAGSRGIKDYQVFYNAIVEVCQIPVYEIEEVVSGNAIGIDQCGEKWACCHNIKVKTFKPNQDLYGKQASFIRNQEMIDYLDITADAVILIWDGKSRGTASTKRMAEKKGLKVYEKIISGATEKLQYLLGFQVNTDYTVY